MIGFIEQDRNDCGRVDHHQVHMPFSSYPTISSGLRCVVIGQARRIPCQVPPVDRRGWPAAPPQPLTLQALGKGFADGIGEGLAGKCGDRSGETVGFFVL